MIIFNLNRLMLQKGIAKPVGYLRKFGIREEMARKIMSGQTKSIKLATIEKICLIMNCTPNDCLERIKTKADIALPPKHSLNVLVRPEPKANLNQLLINANPAKLMKVQKMLLEEDE